MNKRFIPPKREPMLKGKELEDFKQYCRDNPIVIVMTPERNAMALEQRLRETGVVMTPADIAQPLGPQEFFEDFGIDFNPE